MTTSSGSGPDVRVGLWAFPDAPAGALVDAIAHADAAGLDEFWLGDEGPAREPFAVLAAAAVRTRAIRLGVGVTNPYARHPALTAAAMLTVNELSSGRAVLGIGAGGSISLGPFGLDAAQPVEAVARAIRLARAVAAGVGSDGYTPSAHAIRGALPVFVGARGPRLNQLASTLADGVFVAGMPPVLFARVLGWARAVRAVDVALYPSAAFGEEAREQARPRMVVGLLDAPADTCAALGVSREAAAHAAAALRAGDERPARALLADPVLDQMLLAGTPEQLGARLAGLVAEHRPDSIGLAVLDHDLDDAIERASAAFAAMRAVLAGAP